MVPETFFTVSEQMKLFICSCLLGVPLGLCFDVFRTLRLCIPHGKWLVAVEDIYFLLLWSGSLLCFATVMARGEMRGYYVLGSTLGFFLYQCTLGICVVLLLRHVGSALRCVLCWLFRPIFYIVVRIFSFFYRKIIQFTKVFRKGIFFFVFHLNKNGKVLYNKRNEKNGRNGENGKS